CLKPEGALPGAAGAGGRDFNAYGDMAPRRPTEAPKGLRNGGRVKANDVAPAGVYLPNNNILTPHMRSPEYVQMSTAAAITLGVMPGKMHRCGCTRCLNLLLTYPEGCRANCRLKIEEHTSELQSRENLVCRLLLEKKNKQNKKYNFLEA